jgi:hypothetical protein
MMSINDCLAMKNTSVQYITACVCIDIAKRTGDSKEDVFKAVNNEDDISDEMGDKYNTHFQDYVKTKSWKGNVYSLHNKAHPSRKQGGCYANALDETMQNPDCSRTIIGMSATLFNKDIVFMTPHAYNTDSKGNRYDTQTNPYHRARMTIDIIKTPKEVKKFYFDFVKNFKNTKTPIQRWGHYISIKYKDNIYYYQSFKDIYDNVYADGMNAYELEKIVPFN